MPEDPLSRWPEQILPSNVLPRLVRPLPGGQSNASYLVEADGALWVLRINSPNPMPGIDRDREARVLKHAVAAGLAPEVLFCAADAGVLITRYIDGRHWRPHELGAGSRRDRLLELIDRVRQMPLEPPALDYPALGRNYLARMQGDAALMQRKLTALDALLEAMSLHPSTLALVHHDPTPENVIEMDGRLYLLDWEYAAPGPAGLDLAVLVREWRLPPETLTAFFQVDVARIRQSLALYDLLCGMWRLLLDDQQPL